MAQPTQSISDKGDPNICGIRNNNNNNNNNKSLFKVLNKR